MLMYELMWFVQFVLGCLLFCGYCGLCFILNVVMDVLSFLMDDVIVDDLIIEFELWIIVGLIKLWILCLFVHMDCILKFQGVCFVFKRNFANFFKNYMYVCKGAFKNHMGHCQLTSFLVTKFN